MLVFCTNLGVKMAQKQFKFLNNKAETNAELAEEHQQLARTNESLKDENRQLLQTNQELAEECQQVAQANEHLEKENRQLLQTNQELGEEHQQLAEANEGLQDENQQLLQTNQELEEEHQQLAEANEGLQDENRQLLQTNQELEEERQQLAEANEHLDENRQLLQINQENQQLVQTNQQLQEQIQQLLEENQQLVQENQQLQQLRTAQTQLTSTDVRTWTVPRMEVEIQDQIGGGAWGTVARGWFRNQQVAVKWPYPTIINAQTLERLRREVRIMAQVRHPNLLRFIAAVFDDETPPLIITELLDMNLRTAYENGHLQNPNKLPIFCDVAYALHYLHEHEEPIIHRDVSAPNVLLEALPGGTWRAKVSDFGSANLARLSQTLGEGAIIYSAPETFPNTDPHACPPRQTTKIDVYSYGILLCEVVVCQFPDPAHYHDMLRQVQTQWQSLYNLIVSCTRRNPDERPTMLQILDELNSVPHP